MYNVFKDFYDMNNKNCIFKKYYSMIYTDIPGSSILVQMHNIVDPLATLIIVDFEDYFLKKLM